MSALKILQLAHGRVIPYYFSGYSRRCHDLFRGEERYLVSFGGPFLFDRKQGYAEQYGSLRLLISSILKGNRSFEILISEGKYLRKKYLERIRVLLRESDVVVFEGPWLYKPLKKIIGKKFIVYDAHNVEYSLREGNPYQADVREIEGEIVRDSRIIFVVTPEDRELMKKIYGVEEEKLFLVPIQLEIKDYGWNGRDSKDIIFIGSLYEANIIALKEIERIAEELPDFNFHIIGSLKSYPGKKKLKNMVYHGTVEDEEKDRILNSSFLALNPVTMGAGRNVKMIDYMAHGVPILTTPLGLRGFKADELNGIVFIDEVENFKKRILEISSMREVLPEISIKLYEYQKKLFEIETSKKATDIILNRLKNSHYSNNF